MLQNIKKNLYKHIQILISLLNTPVVLDIELYWHSAFPYLNFQSKIHSSLVYIICARYIEI